MIFDICNATRYNEKWRRCMNIRGFRSKALRRFYEDDDRSGLPQKLVMRIADILAIVEAAPKVSSIGTFPGLRLHRLKGDLAGFWSVSVSGNWRIVFRAEKDDVWDLDLIDYH